MEAWAPWRRRERLSTTLAREWGRGALAQGHKDPMADSLSGYVSVSPHHTPSFLSDGWNGLVTFPGDVIMEGTELSLQAAGGKSHIHQFA